MRAFAYGCIVLAALVGACSTKPASLTAGAPPHYAGPVMSIAQPVQFMCAPNPVPWRIRGVETEQGSDGQPPTVTKLSGTVTGIRNADKIVLNFDLNISPPGSPMLMRIERLPTGEISDMSFTADGKIMSMKDSPEVAAILQAVFAGTIKAKEGGYRQGDIVSKVLGHDLLPSLESLDFDGQMIETLAGATTFAGRSAFLLQASGTLTMSANGKSAQIAIAGYSILDQATGIILLTETQVITRLADGNVVSVDTKRSEVIPQ
jgi:hypothetical protein